MGIGRVTRIDDGSGSIGWTYNSLGQVTQERKTTASVVYIVGYAYDPDGNVTKITYPSGRIVNYYRGSTGLITSVTAQANAGSFEVLLAKSVTYQPFGPLQSLTYGNGLVLWKTFTQDYTLNTLVVQQGANSIVNLGYGYANGDFDLTSISDNNVTSRTENYIYTPSHPLQETYGNWGQLIYQQDGVGNRILDVFNDGTTTTSKVLQYAANSNLYVGTTQGATALRTVTNDGAGNIVTDVRGSTTYNYRYNNRGRLDQLTIGSAVTASYAYDGLERMSIRTTQNMTPSATTHYVYDRAGHLLVEASATGTTQREYVWLDDMPLALFADLDTASPKQWYVHPDHLDRPIKMTDANQAVVWDAWYWPYGDVRSITGTATNNLRFPGQYFLVESGLHYNWHRHYDPTIGRYMQADPIRNVLALQPVNLDRPSFSALSVGSGGAGLASNVTSAENINRQIGSELQEFVDGPSVYQYVQGNPVALVDPSGLMECEGFYGAGGTAAGCESGGTYGTGGMFRMGGRILCEPCAIRFAGVGGCSRREIMSTLKPFRIGQ
ncbi:MAG: hypothetical protein JO365_00440 [Bradyrhizobium sp.]|nr:hypothetical protein [Bradyrhizobium sp.]